MKGRRDAVVRISTLSKKGDEKDQDNMELTLSSHEKILGTRGMASEEIILSDNPLHLNNFKNILKKVLKNETSSFKAKSFLDTVKKHNPGFDYRLKRSKYGDPEGIAWMTPEMKKDAIRFGEQFFLDSQKW